MISIWYLSKEIKKHYRKVPSMYGDVEKFLSQPRSVWQYYEVWGSLNKFPDFFCMGTFIDSTHMKL